MEGIAPDLTVFILAGGKSTRMGVDKAFLALDGRTLLGRALDLARSVTPDVRIVGDPAKFSAYASVVEDVFGGCGPLGGIHAALRTSQSDLNLILAVDMPLVSPALLQYLIKCAKTSTATVTVPRTNGRWQPLCAVYRREFADLAEEALREGRYKIDALFATQQTRTVEEEGLKAAGFSPNMFQNLNTPEEFEAVKGEDNSHRDNLPDTEHQGLNKSPEPETEIWKRKSMPDNPKPGPYIEFKDVSKAFGDNVVLDRVSFNVLPAETVCILGRSGVGKSVSLHQIMGFLKPDSGRVIVAGQDITDYTEEQLELIRKKVTMVFQNGALFDSLTVGENVAFPLRESGELDEEQIYQIVDGLLQMVGVQEMRDLLPSDLSTGMKRSVAIARALAARPECVLYDEPTTMVDPLMAQLLGDLIKRLKIQLNLTSIVVTHDMRLAKKLAERVVFLYEARAIFFGTYADMEKSPEPIIQEFLELDELKLEA